MLAFGAVVFLKFIVGDVVFGQIVAQRVIVRIAFHLSFGGFGRSGLVGGAFFFAFFKGGILQQFGMYTVFQFHSR